MSDIAGPPAPKEVQPAVRGTDKAANVAKDPNNQETRSRDTPQDRTPPDQQETARTRDPAVSIAATAAHLSRGQEIEERVARVDAEGRPIVVTESVTIALKPDAGLKPGDEVQLRVTEAETRITADLLRQNTLQIDPPIRLSITIVEVHQQANTPLQTTAAPIADAGYRPPQTPQVSSVAIQQPTDEVALLVGSQQNTANPAAAVLQQTTSLTPPPQIDPSAVLTQTVGQKASSADLATLIQQQQSNATASSAQAQSTGGTLPTLQAVSVAFAPATGPGVGPAIAAITQQGAPAIVQLLNPAVSKVSPVEIATVTNVQSLSAAEARNIPASAATLAGLADPAGELARVETSRGVYVLPAQTAASLSDELVRIVVDGSNSAQSTNPQGQQNQPGYAAQFTAADASSATRVTVSIATGEQATPSTSTPAVPGLIATATVQETKTTGAFLSPDGPRTDLKVTTDIGTLTLTAPPSFRPDVGTQLLLVEPEAGSQTAATSQAPPLTGTIPPVQTVEASVAATATASHTPNLLASWPALEEGIAALAGSSHTGVTQEALANKTAQGGGKLTNALLFFLSATGRGDPTAWLGHNTQQALNASSPSILKNLQSDLRRMASLPSETIGEWRPVILPFDARPTEVPLIAFLLQTRPDIDPDQQSGGQSNHQPDEDESQRFLLQVQFSVLGDIQLDGRINKANFDLTVKSPSLFSTDLKRDLESLFYNALSANGYSGGLLFQDNTGFDIDAAKLIEDHLLRNPAT